MGRAHALSRRVQTAAGGARRQDHAEKFRPRPPLSHHQQAPRELAMTVKVRFAPSPTGRIHAGNIRTALLNWMFARRKHGTLLLRLDDTDTERSTEEFAAVIRAHLAWLGVDGSSEVRQSDRFALYDAAIERLKASGRLYPAYETQDEL